MMKLAILLIAIAFTGLSCKKCYLCQAVDINTNSAYYSKSAVCDDAERTAFEEEYNDTANNSRAVCTRE